MKKKLAKKKPGKQVEKAGKKEKQKKPRLKSNVELGKQLDLYIFSNIVGAGLPLLTPKGATIKRQVENFIIQEELRRGYQYTSTPVIAKSDLYKISGHWQHYKDSMFILKVGKKDFALRPMTCPFQFLIFKSKPRSYKELPIKYAEMSILFRNEQRGELMGLTRMRQLTLADAHIICTEKQLEQEFEKVLNLVRYVMKTLNIKDTWYRFSRGNLKNKKKYIDNPKAWKESEKSLKKILNKLKLKYIEAKDEAAFYGPKLDLQYNNVYGKEDTLITIQIDFALPERFKLTYRDENNKFQTPMIIHRSSVGCVERTIAYLLEKTQGNLPTWLSPIQVRILSFTKRNTKAAEQLVKRLKKEIPDLRVDFDFTDRTVQSKVREAEQEKIPYTIVIGDKEQKSRTIAVRERGKKPKFKIKVERFISELRKEIEERK